jgi:hypothetical protein
MAWKVIAVINCHSMGTIAIAFEALHGEAVRNKRNGAAVEGHEK